MSPEAALLLRALEDPAVVAELRRRLGINVSPPSEDRWMATKEAAAYLGVSTNALHKLTSARAVPFAQDVPGGKCYFKRSELDRWRGSA